MTEPVAQQLSQILADFQMAMLTRSEVTMLLLAMIDAHGAEAVLGLCPAHAHTLVWAWYESVPKTEAGWRREFVFDAVPNIGGVTEYRTARMTDEEIAARLHVLSEFRDYFDSDRS